MKLHEHWRAEYQKKRYLEHVNQDELEQRVRDISTNILTLTPKGQLAPIGGATGNTDRWIILFTHVLEELSIRNGGFREGFMKDTPIPKASWPNVPRAVAALGNRQFESGKCLFKFGKEKHLREALLTGNIRVAPASSYSDPSLNCAIRDDELSFTIQRPGNGAFIRKIDKATLKPVGGKIPVLGNITQTRKVPTDFLVFCLSAKYELRALDDFEADCCLVIKEPKVFIERLLKAVFVHVPNGAAKVSAVDYLDPLNTTLDEVRPYFAKHFRYAYQSEFRVIWLPPKPTPKLQPVFASLGSLEGIAELLTVPVAQNNGAN